MESAGRWLRDVEVRPVRGVEERRRWDALMARHHYLPFHGLFGKSLRHVAVRGRPGWRCWAGRPGPSRSGFATRGSFVDGSSRMSILRRSKCWRICCPWSVAMQTCGLA